MAGTNGYAKGILEEIIQGEFNTLQRRSHALVDLSQVVKTNPKVEIKPSAGHTVYNEDDIVWGFNPKSLSVGDVILTNRETSGYLVAVQRIDAKNPDPAGHPTGALMKRNLSELIHNTKSWKPYVETIADLPLGRNFIGDTRLVLGENIFYTWDNEVWSPTSSSSLEVLAELLDVELTNPVAGDFLQFDGTKWINAPIDVEDDTKLPLAGGTLTGDLIMSAGTMITVTDGPSNPTDAANKDYVDDAVAAIVVAPLAPIISTSINYIALPSDYVILVDSTAGPITISLPGSHVVGKVYYVKDKFGTAESNNITIQSFDADSIDGVPTHVMAVNKQAATVVSDGVDWYLV